MTCSSNTRRAHRRLLFRLSVVSCRSEKSGRGFLHGDYTTRKIGVRCHDASTGGASPAPTNSFSRNRNIREPAEHPLRQTSTPFWRRAALNLNPHPFKPKRVRHPNAERTNHTVLRRIDLADLG